jgi:Family of unknown function (DUF6295)
VCTMISMTEAIRGTGKGTKGWFPLTESVVGYDHSTHSSDEHSLLIDFVNYGIGTDARVAVELDLEAGRTLIAQLTKAIELAEASGV